MEPSRWVNLMLIDYKTCYLKKSGWFFHQINSHQITSISNIQQRNGETKSCFVSRSIFIFSCFFLFLYALHWFVRPLIYELHIVHIKPKRILTRSPLVELCENAHWGDKLALSISMNNRFDLVADSARGSAWYWGIPSRDPRSLAREHS